MKETKRAYYKIVHKDDKTLELRKIQDLDVTYYEYMKEGTSYSVVGILDDLKELAKGYNEIVVEIQEIRREIRTYLD